MPGQPAILYLIGYGAVPAAVITAGLGWLRSRRKERVDVRVGESSERLNYAQAFDRLFDRVSALQQRDEEQQTLIDELRGQLRSREHDLAAVTARTHQLEAELAAERAHTAALSARAAALEAELITLRGEKVALEEQVAALKARLEGES